MANNEAAPVDRNDLEYKAILDHAGVAVIFTRSRQVYRCNRYAEELFGWPEGALIGQRGAVFYASPEDYAAVGARVGPGLAAGQTVEIETALVRHDGSRFIAHLTARAIDPDAPDPGTIWIARDVTEEVQLRESLARSLSEQTLIFERALTGMIFVRDRIILRCNRRFEEIMGYPPGELLGQSTRVYYDSDDDWIEIGERGYRAVRETGYFESENRFRRRDGSPIWCRVTGNMIDPEDPDRGYLWLYEDITGRRAAEDALRTKMQEYALIFDNAAIGISYMRDRVFLRCNRRLEEIFGFPPGGLLGQSARILFSNDQEYEELGRRVYTDVAIHHGFTGEMHYRRHDDGRPIVVRISGQRLEIEREKVWIWTYEDITARRAAEDALLRSNREYAMIFDNAMIGISYMRDRIFLRCNRRLEEIFGFAPGELAGKSSRVLFGSDEAWIETGRRVYAESLPGKGFSGEIQYQRQDGQPIWVRASGRPIAEDGQTIWIWTHQDVTRRHLAEEGLLRSHRELEAKVAERTAELTRQLHFLQELIEAIPGPLFYKDTESRYLGSNRAFQTYIGRSHEDLLGKRPHDIAPPELADKYLAADRALLASPGKQIYEAKIRYADGSLRDVMFHKATMTNPDGSVSGLVGVMLDITERKRMEESLQQAATVFDSSAEGVVITAPDGTIIAVNRAFTEITGYGEDEVVGRNPRLLQSGRQDAKFYEQMWATLARAGRWQGEVWNRRKDGRIYPEWLTISAVKDPAGTIRHYVGVFSDITAIKKAHDQLDFQAHHDPLTGLPNRLLLEDRLATALQRARREQTSLAMLFVDLDRFKNINDTLGHDVGDHVLCEVARRFGALTRESDTVARLGGDEFLIVVESIQDPSAASRIADKILDDLRSKAVTVEQEFFVGASIGISLFPQDGEDAATLMKNADVAMYRAKERGRNTYEFFTKDLTAFSLERFQMETALRHAIERNELFIALQPQFSLSGGELVGAEALVRWQHPEQGLIPPAKFIPLAEESGLIVPLGEWVRRTAFRQWAEWMAAGLRPGVLSVNVSGVEFRRGQIGQSIRAALDATGLAAGAVELEITESSMMSQAENSIQVLHDLRAMGLSLAIDDFGTGYSSLAYLKRLPLNKLKVDQSFVRGLPEGTDDCAIARAVIALGHSLQLKIIAEGVETEAQREFLRREACDEMQGYLRGRPVRAAEFARAHLQS